MAAAAAMGRMVARSSSSCGIKGSSVAWVVGCKDSHIDLRDICGMNSYSGCGAPISPLNR